MIVSGQSLGVELPKVLLNCFHKITFTFPDYAIPKLVLVPQERNPPVIDPLGTSFYYLIINTRND